ncbi:MAG: aminotransferase class IV [Anaerolineales bacterium]|nr:aminotransferase class IV [Anaerolineales bacterium]
MKPICYINGQYVPLDEAQVPVTDLALLRGFGVFETVRTYGGELFRLEDHLDRLLRSAGLIGLNLPWTNADLAAVVHETLEKNAFPETTVRVVLTGGSPGEKFSLMSEKPGLLVLPSPLKPYPPDCYTQGVRVATADVERFLPEAKTLFYLPGLLALQAARRADAEINEVLMVNRHGCVTEGVISNLFLIRDGVLVTPGRDILPGITRQVILDLAEPRMEVKIRDIRQEELSGADEIFLSGTVREVMPVSHVNGEAVGQGGCGPLTRALMDALVQLTRP